MTISRSRLIEVEYSIRISLGVGSIAGNSEAAHVTLPIRIVNFLSLDPPPSRRTMPVQSSTTRAGLDTPEEITLDRFQSAIKSETRETFSQRSDGGHCSQNTAKRVSNWIPKYRSDRLEEETHDGNLTKKPTRSVVIDRSESSDSHQDADPNSINAYSRTARVIGTQGNLTLHDLSNCPGTEDRRDVQDKAAISATELRTTDSSFSTDNSGLRSILKGIATGSDSGRSTVTRPQARRRENVFEPSANMRMREESGGGVESDEEVEMMVGNASVQFDSTEWDGVQQEFGGQSSRRKQWRELPTSLKGERIRRLRFDDDDESDEGAAADCSRQASVENAGVNIFASVTVPAMSEIREEYRVEDNFRQVPTNLSSKGKDHRGSSTKSWSSMEKIQGSGRSVRYAEETGTKNLVLPANEMTVDSPLSEYSTDGTASPSRVITSFSTRQCMSSLVRQPDTPFGSRPEVSRIQSAPSSSEMNEQMSEEGIRQGSPARYRQSILNTYVSPEGSSLRAKIARLEERNRY